MANFVIKSSKNPKTDRSEAILVDGPPTSGEFKSPEDMLNHVRQIANLLDNQFKFAGVKFGWDGIVGLLPGIGDLLTAGLAAYIIWIARQQNVPKAMLVRMIWNAGFDVVIGAVPIIGDAADFAWKSNLKNARLLEKHFAKQSETSTKSKSLNHPGPPKL